MANYAISVTDFLLGQIPTNFFLDVVVIDVEIRADYKHAVIADYESRCVLVVKNNHPQQEMIAVHKSRALHLINPVFYENGKMLIGNSTKISLTKLTFTVPPELYTKPKDVYQMVYDKIEDIQQFSPTTKAEHRCWNLTKLTVTGDSATQKGKTKSFRDLQLQDDENQSIEATLWENMAESPIKLGDVVEVQNATSKVYQAKRKLMINDTPKTKLIKLETPKKTTRSTFNGISKIQPKNITLLDENNLQLSVTRQILFNFLKTVEADDKAEILPDSEDFVDCVIESLPFSAEVQILGSTMLQMKAIE